MQVFREKIYPSGITVNTARATYPQCVLDLSKPITQVSRQQLAGLLGEVNWGGVEKLLVEERGGDRREVAKT